MQVHHVTLLFYICRGALQTFGGNFPKALVHVISLHTNDTIDNITLCEDCHEKLHKKHKRQFSSPDKVSTDLWCLVPRNLPVKPLPRPRKPHDKDAIGFVAFQTLIVIGWFLMNNRVESRILETNSRDLAHLLGKKPGTSFDKSIVRALQELEEIGIINGFTSRKQTNGERNRLELHLSNDYLNTIAASPWFFRLKDISSGTGLDLSLKWLLCFDGGKTSVSYSPKALANLLHLTHRRPSETIQAVLAASKGIPWVKAVTGTKKRITFTLKKRGAVPIHSLRTIMMDCLDHAF